jgi:hypothetical protein
VIPDPPDALIDPPRPKVELPPLISDTPPSPELLFPPLTVTAPPETAEEVKPAEIVTEPPTPSTDEEEEPTAKEMSPPWPVLPPPAPVMMETPPDFPEAEAPVDSLNCPETPLDPESGVYSSISPELVSLPVPLSICTSPPLPDELSPAEKKLSPPATLPAPALRDKSPPEL